MNELKKIASFQVDHTKLYPGVYISRVDHDIVTYDIRLKKPNCGSYLEVPALHTIEHLFATYARSCEFQNNVIYFGPMGCRTGFYLLTKDLPDCDAVKMIKNAFAFIAEYEGEIPGASAIECGNYLEHDLKNAKREAAAFNEVLKKVSADTLNY